MTAEEKRRLLRNADLAVALANQLTVMTVRDSGDTTRHAIVTLRAMARELKGMAQ